MIVARLEWAAEQTVLTPGFEKAYRFLQDSRDRSLADGRVEIDGDAVYAIVQSYETLAGGEPKLEAHRKYADIQYIAGGEEIIGWAPLEKIATTQEYDPASDIVFGKAAPSEVTPVRLSAGELAVFYPSDAHAPRQAAGRPVRVHKIVVKVAVSPA
jgi:biofilm protein TabA